LPDDGRSVSDVSRLTAALSDRYRIERELGRGGMATVYLAEDLKHGRNVAIKLLHPELSAVIGAERFLAEIHLTAQLQHPHILGLIDSGEAGGLLYYVMPYVEGETLRARLVRERQLRVRDAIRIAGEIASALEYAHKRNVIHRDIKPENILLQDDQVLVADFGIALAVSQAGGARLTQTGLSLGTPSYMSPEQAMGEKTVDARSDVYALGALTYEMLQGDPPFTGGSMQVIMSQLLTAKPRPLRESRPNVPVHVEAAVLTALEKLPADRQASAAEFARALTGEAMLSTEMMRVPAAALPPAAVTPALPARRLAASALALVAAGAAVGWAVARLGGASAPAALIPTVTSILAPAGGTFGERRSLALSPDGRQLAFVFAAGDGTRMLWRRQLDRLEPVPLARTEGADAPFWSPDGRSLAFFAGGNLTLREENGEVRRLCPASDPTGGSWSAKGVIVFGHREGLSLVPAGGGTCRLVVPRDSGPPMKPAFLPDGERVLYARGRGADMVVAGPDGATLGTLPLRVQEFSLVAPDLILLPSGTDYRAVDAQRLDLRALALVGSPIRIASDVRTAGGVHTFSVSAAGAFAYLPSTIDRPYLEYDASGLLRDTVRVEGTWTLAARPRGAGAPTVAVAGAAVGIWLYDLDADRATRLVLRDSVLGVSQLGRGPAWPVFDATGTRLAYAVYDEARCAIFERDLTTDVERLVTQDTRSFGECPYPLDWSPDGAQLLVRRDSSLHGIALDGTRTSLRIARPGRVWEGSLSPDGRAVAYSSDETGRVEVYVQSLPTGSPARVSLEGGRWPTWSHGGRRLTFVTPDGRVQETELGSAPPVPLGTPRTRFAVPTWRRSLFDDRGTGFDMVGDGERFLLRVSPTALAVSYVQHWPTLLRRADSTKVQP
jgi:serine/threonine-protein kinase